MQGYTQKSQHLGCTVTWQDIALLSVQGRYRLFRDMQQETEQWRLEGWFIVACVWDIEL